jgi:hypothetical protein
VGVDQARDQRVAGEVRHAAGLDLVVGLGPRQQRGDAAAGDGAAVAGEGAVGGVHGQDPVGVDEEVGLHRRVGSRAGRDGAGAVSLIRTLERWAQRAKNDRITLP